MRNRKAPYKVNQPILPPSLIHTIIKSFRKYGLKWYSGLTAGQKVTDYFQRFSRYLPLMVQGQPTIGNAVDSGL